MSLRLLRSDIDDLPVATRAMICAQLIAEIEATPMDARSHIQRAELPDLKDRLAHYEHNVSRNHQANPYTSRGGTVACHRCGAAVAIPKH